MQRVRKILRAVVVTTLLVVVGLPVGLYIIVSTPWAQDKLRVVACDMLSETLGTTVEIDRVNYYPFNTLALTGVRVEASGQPALSVAKLSARFELWHFLRTGRIEVDYAVIDGPTLSLWRSTPDSPLNIQPIIDKLQPKDKTKPPTPFDLKIGTFVLHDGRVTYDVRSLPDSLKRINPNHLEVSDLNIHAYLRHASNDCVDLEIESMSLCEKSGLRLSELRADFAAEPDKITLRSFALDMGNSHISLRPIEMAIDGYAAIPEYIATHTLHLMPAAPIKLDPADFNWLAPGLFNINRIVTADFDIDASRSTFIVNKLNISDSRGIELDIMGSATDIDSLDIAEFNLLRLSATAPAPEIASIVHNFNPSVAAIIGKMGNVALSATGSGTMRQAQIDLKAGVDAASLAVIGSVTTPDRYRTINFEAETQLSNFVLSTFTGNEALGSLSAAVDASGLVAPNELSVDFAGDIANFDFKGYSYQNVSLQGVVDRSGKEINANASINSDDPNARFALDIDASTDGSASNLAFSGQLDCLDLNALGFADNRDGYKLSANVDANVYGSTIDDAQGYFKVKDLTYANADGDSYVLHNIAVTADRSSMPQSITIESDVLNGSIEGKIVPSTLATSLRDMASHIVPDLLQHDDLAHNQVAADHLNNFNVNLTLADAEGLSRFFNLPVIAIYPVELTANVDSENGQVAFMLDAPYLQQGDKIIDSTVLGAMLDTADDRATMYASTHMPTKKGPMTVVLGCSGSDSRFDTTIDWQIDRKIPLNGLINFSTALSRGDNGKVCAITDINPGEINFGDDVWAMDNSIVTWCDDRLTVDDFSLKAGKQVIAIDGRASQSPDDVITVDLQNIKLESIFETLEIDNALIGGIATGTVKASQALSKQPILTTDNLHVESIGYNYCTMGTADIVAHWDNDRQAFFLDADIVNPENQHSRIWGDIFPSAESLDLNFDATHIKVGFMKPFMSAFASDLKGYVSGKARLFGTFHNIDMEGDVFAEDLKLKIDFTNTWYGATDSIHIRPGSINLDNITITDENNHTAKLSGYLHHDYFHSPVFDFRVTDAKEFMCYNVSSKQNQDWYGTIYGNGSASIVGRPGIVEIGADMTTTAGSTFTFVLSDQLEAEQYSFITFNDVTPQEVRDEQIHVDDIPTAVKEYQARMISQNTDSPSAYIMDLKVDITPDAQVILVMDPVGGDRIRAYGSGDLRMAYNSIDNDIRMWGSYTLDRGSYNFTLQDIIIKDFTINSGSTITFRGDPYSATLDIEAVYSVNANLTDLDESFTQDKDLNRTNVPVQAIMKVSGDMRQPDLDFDLGFPTLSSDTYRKVRSIISTDEMMNRQIIYLLALNRFYTPDYMATTKGNELFSVASSTISSQLSSMLGKLSDNWSIAPNLRSDRGDFSDIEVDVALSSRLLNNRLLLNGNLGYRDKSLNTNQFIGDFDVEYLLTPRGTWRLKAYNRYNDQNYYLRTAATTQGVGIMFRRDFDSLFRRNASAVDTAPAQNVDTIATNFNN